MQSGGHRSGGGSAVPGAGGGAPADGALCHACGYQYPNGHPSAKQRRAHRKHCGKLASAAAEEAGAVVHEARVLVPGEGGGAGGGGGGGDGIGAGAAECGGSLPGSAQEPGSAAVGVDETEHSSRDNSGVQAITDDKYVEDHSDVASEITPEVNKIDDAEYSGIASLPEEVLPNVPASAVTNSEQLQDVSVPDPVLPPEPGYRDGISPELSEMQNSNIVSEQASDATGGEISEKTNDAITIPNCTTVSGVDGTHNAIDKDIPSEEKSVIGADLDSSCQENLQTKAEVGHSNTAVEEHSSDKNLNAVQTEEIPNDKPEPNQQSSPMLTSSIKEIHITKEPIESGTQEPVGTDDFHSEATDTVKPQGQPDSTSVADHVAIPEPEQTDIFKGEHYSNKDGAVETVSSAIGPDVNAETISVADADDMIKNVCSSDVTMGDNIRENVTSDAVVSSQADLVDLSTSSTGHEKGQNEKSIADLTTHEINEMNIPELLEEKQQDKEVVTESIPLETNAVCNVDNYIENEKETVVEASSCNIPSTSSIEEEKQTEDVIASPASEKTNVTSNQGGVEEDKQIKADVNPNREIGVSCSTKTVEEKDTTSDISADNITNNEDKKQIEEISAGSISDGISMINSSVNEQNMHNEDMTEDPSSHEKIVVNGTDKEETMVDPTSHSVGMVTTVDSVGEGNNDETSADLTSHGVNAAHATDNAEEQDAEPIVEPISSNIGTVGSVVDVKEKQQNEGTTADQMSGESNMPKTTYDAEKDVQNKDAATVLVSDKSEAMKKTDAVEGTELKEEPVAKEISTIQSMDDLKGAGENEEIADKEVIVDSDRCHVSLKVLLADKNVETKEKKPSTKDRVLSFRRRSSKDNESPVKPGSPKAGSEQQDWNSPARLPAEKKSKGKKQQWVPFICCPSIH